MIFSIVIWLVIIASLIYLLIRKIIKEENEDFENREVNCIKRINLDTELVILNGQKEIGLN